MDIFDRINEYASRSLSYDSDALNAFQGILKVFEKAACPVYHYWGVPIISGTLLNVQNINWITRFALGLTWVTQTAGKRREGLPSWSWTGWKGWENLSFPHSVVDGQRHPGPNFRHANLRIVIHSTRRQYVFRPRRPALKSSLIFLASPKRSIDDPNTMKILGYEDPMARKILGP